MSSKALMEWGVLKYTCRVCGVQSVAVVFLQVLRRSVAAFRIDRIRFPLFSSLQTDGRRCCHGAACANCASVDDSVQFSFIGVVKELLSSSQR